MVMRLPAFAEAQELSDWLGEPITDDMDIARATRILRAVSNLIRGYTGKSWVDNQKQLIADLPEPLIDVTLSCAARYYVNPNAETQWTSQIDDAMDGGGRKVESSGIYLTDSEQRLLDSVVRASSGVLANSVCVVNTTRGDANGYESEAFPWFVIAGQ